MDFDEFSALLEELVAEIPPRFLEGVSGIFAVPEEKPDPELPGVYLLGQYHQRQDGKYIQLFHGSFLAMGWRGRKRFVEEVRDTLLHEIQHHWEESAGIPDLRDEDEARLERFRKRGGNRRRRRAARAGGWRELAWLLLRPLFFVGGVLAAVFAFGWLLERVGAR